MRCVPLACGLVLLTMAAAAEPDPAVLLGHAPWPGMTAWDVAWCRELVWSARVVELRSASGTSEVVVKDVRGWLKPNGFYGLRLNGNPVDESTVWLMYAGHMTNLRVLFTYGSAPLEGDPPNEAFRD